MHGVPANGDDREAGAADERPLEPPAPDPVPVDGTAPEARPWAATTFRLGPRAHWNPVVSSLFIALVGLVPAVVLGFALRSLHPLLGIALGLSLAVVATVWPQMTLTVGVDGLSFGRRFLGYGDIAAILRGDDFGRGIVALLVVLESGERIEVHCMVPEREAMLARAVAARTRFLAERRETEVAGLRKGLASAQQWVRHLRALGAGASLDHRTPPVPTDTLWQALESAGAEPGVRAAAAVALRETLDDDGRRRLLEVADATASRKLRIALETVAADQDDQALAEALAAAEAEPRPRRRTAG